MAKVKQLLENVRSDIESDEHEFVVDCLKHAIKYCFEQYHDTCGEIDPLPSVSVLGLSNEDDKFVLIDELLKVL